MIPVKKDCKFLATEGVWVFAGFFFRGGVGLCLGFLVIGLGWSPMWHALESYDAFFALRGILN